MNLPIEFVIALVFGSVGTAAGAVLWLLTEPHTTKRRLTEVVAGPGGAALLPQQSVIAGGPSASVRRASAYLPKSPKEMRRVQRMMVSAGFENEWATVLYGAVQLALPISLVLVVLSRYGTSPNVLVFAGLGAALAYYVPSIWLGRQIQKRKTEIRNGLPDAIDLLIVCIESGSGVDQAIAKVGEEIAIAYPALSREMMLISAETRAGTTRMQAFKNFADRTKVDDVRSLVTMLIQTDKFGTSLGQALRTHSEVSRTKRRQRAEEKAAKLGVKLLFPLVFCLFPAFYVVVIGSAGIQIYRQLVEK